MIKYRAGYKYQLAEDYTVQLSFVPAHTIINDFIIFKKDGKLTAKKGYAWDGPSGPTIDTRTFMRGSLIHDCLYQLIREKYLPRWFKKLADLELKRICLEDGMWKIRAKWVYQAVEKFADSAADPKNKRPILIAP